MRLNRGILLFHNGTIMREQLENKAFMKLAPSPPATGWLMISKWLVQWDGYTIAVFFFATFDHWVSMKKSGIPDKSWDLTCLNAKNLGFQSLEIGIYATSTEK